VRETEIERLLCTHVHKKHKHSLGCLRYFETQKAYNDKEAAEGKLSCHGMHTHRDPFLPRRFDIIDDAGCVSLHCECDAPCEVEEWIEYLAAAAIGATFRKHSSAHANAPHGSTNADAATTEHEVSSQLPQTQCQDSDGEETREMVNLSRHSDELDMELEMERGGGGVRGGGGGEGHVEAGGEVGPHAAVDGSFLEASTAWGKEGGAMEEDSRVSVLLTIDTEACTAIKGGGRVGGGYAIDCGVFAREIARAVKCGDSRVLVAGISAQAAGLPELYGLAYLLVEFVEEHDSSAGGCAVGAEGVCLCVCACVRVCICFYLDLCVYV
jgi:hypothetical protein